MASIRKYKGKQSRFTGAEVARIAEEFAQSANKLKLAERYGISRGYLYRLVQGHPAL